MEPEAHPHSENQSNTTTTSSSCCTDVCRCELLTVLHLLGQLVVLQQRSHVSARCALHEGLHVRPLLTQPEVKVSEPEDLVEPRGDVGCNEIDIL